jgi:hypothetical protein
LPRGLGDSPLKREKKLRHSSSRRSHAGTETAAAPELGSSVPRGTNVSEVQALSSRSYNDVFFQRRPDIPAADTVQEAHLEARADVPFESQVETPIETPVAAPIEVATAPVEAITVPDFTAVTEAAALVASEQVPSVEAAPLEASPVEVAPAPVVEPAPEAAAVQAEPSHVAETSQQPEKKAGFLGRIFGKWRK